MPWKVVERKIGRAGGMKQRTARQGEWDRKYGEGQWAVGYVIGGAFVLQEAALESIYNRSYEEHFAGHRDDLEELIRLAKSLRVNGGSGGLGGAATGPRCPGHSASRRRSSRGLGSKGPPFPRWRLAGPSGCW
jgi:hypothetical protein